MSAGSLGYLADQTVQVSGTSGKSVDELQQARKFAFVLLTSNSLANKMATDKALALVAVSNPSPGVRVLALNRPQKRNALSQELIDTLGRELRTAQEDDDVRVVVLTGSKTLFSGKKLVVDSMVPAAN